MLIYFTPELQQRALALFAFAIRPGGYLVLGNAESANPVAEHFAVVHPAMRLYRRQGVQAPVLQPIDRTARMHAHRERPVVRTRAAREMAQVRQQVLHIQSAQLATQELLLHLSIGLVAVDRRYDIQLINTAARRLRGIHGNALGEDLIHLVEREVAEPLRTAIDAVFAGETRTPETIQSRATASGEPYYLRVSAHRDPTPAKGQAEETVLLTLTDVTHEVLSLQAVTADMAQAQAEIARLQAAVVLVNASYHALLRRMRD